MSWEKIPFGKIADFKNGLNYSRDNFGTGLKVISVADFGDRWIPDYAALNEINPNGVAKDADLLDENDILFVRSNGNKELVGRIMLLKGLDQPVSFSGFCIRARITTLEALPEFIAYLFRDLQTRRLLIAGGVGTNISNISQKTLSKFLLPMPPLKVQQQLVNILSKYDGLIATNQRRIQLLEEAARRLYREWFVHLRFPGHEEVSVEDGIPEGWRKESLGNLAEVIMGQSPKSEFYNKDGQGLPFHQGVTQFGKRFVTDITFTTEHTREAKAGDILCSVRAPVGRLNICRNKIAIGRGLSTMCSKLGWQSLLYYQLKDYFVQEDMIGGGAIFASVGKKELLGQKLLQPTDELADRFNDLAKKNDDQIECLSQQNSLLQQARDQLLPRLMSAQMDISRIKTES